MSRLVHLLLPLVVALEPRIVPNQSLLISWIPTVLTLPFKRRRHELFNQ